MAEIGTAHGIDGRSCEAVAAFRRATAMQPLSALLWERHANSLFQSRAQASGACSGYLTGTRGAVQSLARALALSPAHGPSLRQRALVLVEEARRVAAAQGEKGGCSVKGHFSPEWADAAAALEQAAAVQPAQLQEFARQGRLGSMSGVPLLSLLPLLARRGGGPPS